MGNDNQLKYRLAPERDGVIYLSLLSWFEFDLDTRNIEKPSLYVNLQLDRANIDFRASIAGLKNMPKPVSNDKSTELRTLQVDIANPLFSKSAGINYLPVKHQENTQSSEEEVFQIVESVNSLLGTPLARKDGSISPVERSDMLFVAPYNAQVSLL